MHISRSALHHILHFLQHTRLAVITLTLMIAVFLAPLNLSTAKANVRATLWVTQVINHPVGRQGLIFVGEIILEHTGMKTYLHKKIKTFFPQLAIQSEMMIKTLNFAIKQGKSLWCTHLPDRCSAYSGSLPLPSNLSGMIMPVAKMILQNRSYHLIKDLHNHVMTGQLTLGVLTVLSLAHTEHRFRQLQEEIRRSHQKITTQISQLSQLFSAQMRDLQEVLKRVERKIDDQLQGKLQHAHACTTRLKYETNRILVDGCLQTILSAHSEVVQRGYTPQLELTLLGMELALLVATQNDNLNPQHLKVIWNSIDTTPSPHELREKLISAACEHVKSGAHKVLLHPEGQRASSSVQCEFTGSWLTEALKDRLHEIDHHLAHQDNEKFKELRQNLTDQMRALLGLNHLRALRQFAQDADSDHLVESAEQRTQRWIQEETKGLDSTLYNTLKLHISLTPHLKKRSLKVTLNKESPKPNIIHKDGESAYHYTIKLQSNALTLRANLTYFGVIPGMTWVTACQLTLNESILRDIANHTEGLTGNLHCTQDGEVVSNAISYVIKSSFHK